jgi:hypothetical protein
MIYGPDDPWSLVQQATPICPCDVQPVAVDLGERWRRGRRSKFA